MPVWLQFIERGGVFKNLYRLRFRDGQYHWVAATGVSLNERDGTIREWIGTFNDITDRKHAEEALRQKEEEYRSIFEQALEGIYRTTPEGKSLAANPALAKILGYSSPDELVTSITDTTAQMWADPAQRQTLAELMGRGEVVRGFECQWIRKDSEKIWVSVNGHAVRDPAGKTLYYEGFIEDIHERKLAEQKLRESEGRERARAQQLETILDTIPVPVLITHDPECKKITRNRAAWEQLGVARPESGALGTSQELRHRYLKDGVPIAKGQLAIEQAAATGRPAFNASTTLVREDGTQRHEIGNAAPLLDEHGQIWGAVAAKVDITERVHAEEALRASEERLRLAQEVAQIGSFDWNLITRELNCSSILPTIYGLRPGQLPRNYDDCLQLIHPDDRAYAADLLKRSNESGEGAGEWRVLWPDRTVRWIRSQWRILKR